MRFTLHPFLFLRGMEILFCESNFFSGKFLARVQERFPVTGKLVAEVQQTFPLSRKLVAGVRQAFGDGLIIYCPATGSSRTRPALSDL